MFDKMKKRHSLMTSPPPNKVALQLNQCLSLSITDALKEFCKATKGKYTKTRATATELYKLADDTNSKYDRSAIQMAFSEKVGPCFQFIDCFSAILPFESSILWGCIKYLLQTAQDDVDSLAKIADMFAAMGGFRPVTIQEREIVRYSRLTCDLVSSMYVEILRCCTCVVKFSRKRGYKSPLRAIMKPVESEYATPLLRFRQQRDELHNLIQLEVKNKLKADAELARLAEKAAIERRRAVEREMEQIAENRTKMENLIEQSGKRRALQERSALKEDIIRGIKAGDYIPTLMAKVGVELQMDIIQRELLSQLESGLLEGQQMSN